MILRRLWLLLALLFAAPAAAHLTPNSEVRLDFGERAVTADIIVPQGEYAYATGNPVTDDAASQSLAERYLAEHMSVHAPDGRAWAVDAGRVLTWDTRPQHAIDFACRIAGRDLTADEWRTFVGTGPQFEVCPS